VRGSQSGSEGAIADLWEQTASKDKAACEKLEPDYWAREPGMGPQWQRNSVMSKSPQNP